MLSASTSMPCSSMALMRSVPMTRVSGFTLRPIKAMASGKAQCACTSTVFTRRPFTTTSRRLGAGCACACVACISSQPTKATPAMAPVMPPMKSLRVVMSSSPCRIVLRKKYLSPGCARKGGASRDRIASAAGDVQATAACDMQRTPSAARASRVAAIEPSTSMLRHASSITTTSRPSRCASSAE